MDSLKILENGGRLNHDEQGLRSEQFDTDLALLRHRQAHPAPNNPSFDFCEFCGVAIPEARRIAIPGVELCVDCQADEERRELRW